MPVPVQATALPGPFEWNMSNVFQVILVSSPSVGEKVPPASTTISETRTRFPVRRRSCRLDEQVGATPRLVVRPHRPVSQRQFEPRREAVAYEW